MWQLHLAARARKELDRLPAADWRRVSTAIAQMHEDPLFGDVVKLKGQNAFRRRVGDYRILFDLDYRTRSVCVFAVMRRTTTTYR